MKIDRHNYEEFFLMYVDNELTAVERAAVETFVQQNPDLSEELAMLQQSVLLPEDIAFTAKENLYRNEQAINIHNYEEYFLLDVDNELDTKDKEEVEKFVLQHPKLQDEYTLLHQTKLTPEVIEFKNKELLYRSEEKERRVIPIGFTRFAVAASVLGLAAALWFFSADKNSDKPAFASVETKISIPVQQKQTAPQINDQNVTADEVKVQQTVAQQVKTKQLNTTGNSPVELHTNKNISTQIRDEESFAYTTPEKQTQPERINTITDVATPVAEPEPAITASNKIINHTNTSYARPAVYTEADEEDENNSFYIGGVEINKNKLRGLMKKASTLFDKKAKNDDSERTIQIASFEIKTK